MGEPMKQVLVVGGGVAGMAAARTLDQYGLQVLLVERDERLGGHAAQWACMATDQCRNCGACLAAASSASSSPRVAQPLIDGCWFWRYSRTQREALV